ncbi:hypothetical protein IWZ00DRAFT_508072 [Phyllosticta capitalensis]
MVGIGNGKRSACSASSAWLFPFAICLWIPLMRLLDWEVRCPFTSGFWDFLTRLATSIIYAAMDGVYWITSRLASPIQSAAGHG